MSGPGQWGAKRWNASSAASTPRESHERRQVRVAEVRGGIPQLLDEGVALDLDPGHLADLADDHERRDPGHVADEDGLGEQVRQEAEPHDDSRRGR